MRAGVLQSGRVGVALACFVLALVLALANALPAQGQNRGGADVPSELWRTYPLDPNRGSAPIQPGTETGPQQVSPPPAGQTTPAPGSESREVGQPPSPVGENDSRTYGTLMVLVLAVIGFVVVVLVARPAARLAVSVPGSLVRFGSAVASPVRSVAGASRPRRRPRSRPVPTTRPTDVTARPAEPHRPRRDPTRRRGLGTAGARAASGGTAALRAPARVGTGMAVGTRSAGARAASGGLAVLRVPVRVGAGVAAGLRHAGALVLSKRNEIVFYAVAALAGASLGLLVLLFLN